MDNEHALLLGIDIGGTKLGLCVGTTDGRVLAHETSPMDHTAEPMRVLTGARDRLLEMAEQFRASDRAHAEIIAVGAACPGPLDYRTGCFIDPPNMPGWHGFGMREAIKELFGGMRSAMMNDANATALAEWLWGAARGASTAVYFTMSTGMGAGLILDGRLYEGPLGLAGEIGHLRLGREDAGPVGFGRRGSIEGYLSGPGMTQLAQSEALACSQRGEPTALSDTDITPARLFAAARTGDAAAVRVTDRVAIELGRLMAVLTDVLNPEVFVLGTIGSAAADVLIEPAMRVLREEAMSDAAAIVRVVPSGLSHRGHQSALAVAARTLTSA